MEEKINNYNKYMKALNEIVRESVEKFREETWVYDMSDECRSALNFDFISSQISLLEEMQKWAEEKEKFYTESRYKAQDRHLMIAWQDFESKRMATVSLLDYLQDQITKCKELMKENHDLLQR